MVRISELQRFDVHEMYIFVSCPLGFVHAMPYLYNMNKPVLIPDNDNPFRELILRAKDEMKEVEHTVHTPGVLVEEIMTITMTRKYQRGAFTKLYTGKERDAILMLSPYACKVFMHIAMTLEYNEQRIKITPEMVGIDRRTLSKALMELMAANVLYKARKPHWYWVNVTVIIMGKL